MSAADLFEGHLANAQKRMVQIKSIQDRFNQLIWLRVKIKFNTAQKSLTSALDIAAQRMGMTPEDLLEMGIPDYGMKEVGRLVETLGDFTAEISIPDSRTIDLTWIHSSGTRQQADPAQVKSEHGKPLKALKRTVQELEKMVRAQVLRLEQIYLERKSWSLQDWKERFLDHPLVGIVARRLVWRFENGSSANTVIQEAIWNNGALRNRKGHPIDLPADTRVILWHPLDSLPSEIEAWRLWLEENEIRQPFKQAHREVYILTPAEEVTENYSNRFAAHVLKQHQFHALTQERGWKNLLQIHHVDCGAYRTHRTVPAWNVWAEYWVGGAGTERTIPGVLLYLATDQVRFYDENFALLPLRQVNPLLYSEIMRDVDLFVGVCSVGNDPNWLDQGARPEYATHGAYWQSYAFGDLNSTAKTRKALLERLIPKLKIAPVCSFTDKFLVVRGSLRTYKIHLGSGNILMLPEDRYLCIVQGSKAGDKVFLPFEDDALLSVILSKAFLLADDDKIKDQSILLQIKR